MCIESFKWSFQWVWKIASSQRDYFKWRFQMIQVIKDVLFEIWSTSFWQVCVWSAEVVTLLGPRFVFFFVSFSFSCNCKSVWLSFGKFVSASQRSPLDPRFFFFYLFFFILESLCLQHKGGHPLGPPFFFSPPSFFCFVFLVFFSLLLSSFHCRFRLDNLNLKFQFFCFSRGESISVHRMRYMCTIELIDRAPCYWAHEN